MKDNNAIFLPYTLINYDRGGLMYVVVAGRGRKKGGEEGGNFF